MRRNHSAGTSRVMRTVARMPWDKEARIMSRLPKAIRAWLLYDAPADIAVASIAAHVRKVGAAQALEDIKRRARAYIVETYGEDHPQAQV